MSEETNWTEHVASGEAWFRFVLMLLFTPFLGCVGFLILSIALFQFFSVLASGESNPQLRELGRDLSRFAVAIVDFLTYNTERKPFPFTNSPAEETAASVAQPEPVSEASRPVRQEAATRKKPATRKRSTSTRKKKPARRSTKSGEEGGSGSLSEQTEPGTSTDTTDETHGE